MCQDECVAMVKEMMVKLWREKIGLVERLNAIHDQIEQETDLLSKVLLKVEWMAEKQRSVEPMQKVSIFPTFVPPSSNSKHLDARQLTHLPIPSQIVQSLQMMLKVDGVSAGMTPAASEGESCQDRSSVSSEVSEIDDVGKNATPRNYRAFLQANQRALPFSEQPSIEIQMDRQRRSCEQQQLVADVEDDGADADGVGSSRAALLNRLQTELFTLTMARIADGSIRESFVRESSVPQPPSQVRWYKNCAAQKPLPIYEPAARLPNDDTTTCPPPDPLDDSGLSPESNPEPPLPRRHELLPPPPRPHAGCSPDPDASRTAAPDARCRSAGLIP